MKTSLLMFCLCAASMIAFATPAEPSNLDASKIERLTGLKPTHDEREGTWKVASPRADVSVSVDGQRMPPFMGLTTWATFMKGTQARAMVMGDFVLFEDEVNPVMSAALENGLAVTALHNHFFFDEPRVYFMHIGGEGSVEQLATGVRKALDKVKEVRATTPKPAHGFGGGTVPDKSTITPKPIEEVLGVVGQAKDGMCKFVWGSKARMACGCEVGKEMGVNTWAAFRGTDDNALVDGDFAVREHELQAVLKTLRRAGIQIVAIHHHMTGETPRTLFLHYWGRGPATVLARGLKAALDQLGPE